MRDQQTGWISLHPGEFFLVWTSLGLGEPPSALGVGHLGRTQQARAEFVAAAGEAMAERELGTVEQPAADLAAYLHTIAAAERRLELDVDIPDASLWAVGAVDGQAAAAAASMPAEVRVGPARATNLVPTMLEVLPPLGAGRGVPANLQVTDFEAACAVGEREGVGGFTDALRAAQVRGQEVNVVTKAVADRVGGGRLSAYGRDGDGPGWRAASTVNWVDTPEGRYAMRRHGDWLTVTPVDLQRLLGMAEDMLAALAR